jgi:prepilin-type N-terminal cleavage/methylation domain-containing protein/prepilin-type processing-associated H-X9-DG protein
MKTIHHQPRAARPAFTLIELLVVIAVIAILLGLLSPSLAAARKRGYSTACMNNLKQMSAAIQMYLNEHEDEISGLSGIFPAWTDTSSTQAWTKLIYPYVKTTRVYLDPGRPGSLPEIPIHYYLNLLPSYVEAGGNPSNGTPFGAFLLKSKSISNPAAFVLLSDDLWIQGLQQDIDPTNETGDKSGFTGGNKTYPPYHMGRVNVAFADGHVATVDHFDTGNMTYWYDAMGNWQATKPE